MIEPALRLRDFCPRSLSKKRLADEAKYATQLNPSIKLTTVNIDATAISLPLNTSKSINVGKKAI